MAAATRRTSGPALRSLSPSARFSYPKRRRSRRRRHRRHPRLLLLLTRRPFSARASSTAVVHRSSSPTRVNLYNPARSVRFSLERSSSPSRSVAVVNRNNYVLRNRLSPSGRFSPSFSSSSSSSALASYSTAFSARASSTAVVHRSSSPTHVNLYNPARSLRFSLERRSVAVVNKNNHVVQKRTCMCSPTNHPGSFRCSLGFGDNGNGGNNYHGQTASYRSNPNRLNMRRLAMTNSLVRIGAVGRDLVKKALAAVIRPSSHRQRRRGDFQPRPSRLSAMSKA